MKIKVIQGTVVEKNLTFGRLKLLGVSSEGFVCGKEPMFHMPYSCSIMRNL